ncbi:MAG: CRISPR-associated endonuclease Cas2 [Candidatus Nitrosoglobus sp.]|jgi:CRISPR-associated protein Cas2
MPDNARRLHLICYDIVCLRRLGQIYHCLKDWAAPVQYSIFVAKLNHQEVGILAARLASRIHPRQDDIRIYPLSEKLAIHRLGSGALPEGVYLFAGDVEGFLEALERD